MNSVTKMAKMLRDGTVTARELVLESLSKINQTDDVLNAWTWLDRHNAIFQAEELDKKRARGDPLGALHGIPIGLKDIIDTADMPTEFGSIVFKDRQPTRDADLVSHLKSAGAIIIGKTVTTPFAFRDPAGTKNPVDTNYSPGGSSSGSAAAVAAGHVTLAVGTQTNGSVIRPASFCGVFGFKPSFSKIPRSGVFRTSKTLDQVGVFANNIVDIALLSAVLTGKNIDESYKRWFKDSFLLKERHSSADVGPRLAWLEMPYFDQLSAETESQLKSFTNHAALRVDRLTQDNRVLDFVRAHNLVHYYEIARELVTVFENHSHTLSEDVISLLKNGLSIEESDYQNALGKRQEAIQYFDALFSDYDAIIAPASGSEAPLFSAGTTGNPIFSTIWTLCGLPCITMPLLKTKQGMPIGVQLIGRLNDDCRLLEISEWLLKMSNSSD